MTLTLVPYAQKVISDYLRSHSAVAALTSRVVSKRPSTTGSTWVQVTQIDGRDASSFDHLIDFAFQFDCYADPDGGLPQANLLGRTVRAALVQAFGTHDGVVISGVVITGDRPLPDPDLKDRDGNPRDRQIIDATIWMHS
jgi:hypothetical protein